MQEPNNQQEILPSFASDDFLLERYQASIDNGELAADQYQKEIMNELQIIFKILVEQETSKKNTYKPSYLNKLFSWANNETQVSMQQISAQKGLYIWGGVGRGKTHLVNYFYQLLPIKKKLRLHFHRFMQLVHEELESLNETSEPLKIVAENITKKTKILCLDEMHVNDITNAMLLGRLFEHLFNRGIILVTTSNIPPHQLYKNGLQRERFLPAIQLLEDNTKVVKIGGQLDYRLRTLEEKGVYHISTGTLSEQRLETYFNQLSGVELHKDRNDIIINKRRIPVKKWADGIAWFSFDELCNSPRSAMDYHQIGTFFNTVIISNIPVMGSQMDDAAKRFVIMIDEFYDLHVNLVVSAATEPEQLYKGNKLTFEFKRTASRLREMQSKEYIATKHLNGSNSSSELAQ